MKKKPWQKYVLVAAGVAMLSALSISEYVDHRTLQDHSRIFPTKPVTLVVPYAAGAVQILPQERWQKSPKSISGSRSSSLIEQVAAVLSG